LGGGIAVNDESESAQNQDAEVGRPGTAGPAATVSTIADGDGQSRTELQRDAVAAGTTAPARLPGMTGLPAARQAPDPGEFHAGRWWAVVVVFLVAGAAFSSWVALGSAFDHGHRLSASATALLDVVVLAALIHVILFEYQSGASGVLTGLAHQEPGEDQGVQETLAFRRRGLKGAVIGQDGRASTSKTQVVLWTAAVLWALIDLLLLARSYPGGNIFTSTVTSNWRPEYLVLLGLPVAAAATAKAAVSGSNSGVGPLKSSTPDAQPSQQATRVYVRDPVPAGVKGFNAGVAELFTSDDGTVAWSDLQYVVFTMITLVFFAAQVLAQPQNGLPAVPAALLTLMGVSVSGYAAKKIVDTQGSVPT
jgi:hypothetical protein